MTLHPNGLFTSIAILLLTLSLPLNRSAQSSERELRAPASQNETSFDHSAWDKILKQSVVVDGPISQVKYGELKKHPDELIAYLKGLESVTENQFSKLPEPEKLAFLINAYNALTVKLIVDHYPVKSIKDIGGVFTSPWKKKFFTLLGGTHHLDDIEHEMIRKNFREPRIHFALVCASRGCPALRAEAYVASRLNSQLDDAARAFLNDPSRNYFDPSQSKLYLSSIFKWYGEDFKKASGTVPAFVARYMNLSPQDKQRLIDSTIQPVFLDYDWSLNDVRPTSEKQVGQKATETDHNPTGLMRKASLRSPMNQSREPSYNSPQHSSNHYSGRSPPQERNPHKPAQAPAEIDTNKTANHGSHHDFSAKSPNFLKSNANQAGLNSAPSIGSSTENELSPPGRSPFSHLPNRQIAGSATELLDAIQSSGLAPGSSLEERWIFQQKATKYIPPSRGEYNSMDWGSTTEYGSGTEKGSTTESSSGLAY